MDYRLEDLEIDKTATASNVREFFKPSGKFETYLRRAGFTRFDLKSPQIDPTGISGSHGFNTQENSAVAFFDYQNKCLAVYSTIAHCDFSSNPANPNRFNREILRLCYIEELEDWQVAERIGLSSSRYRDLKQLALYDFAERLPIYAFKFHTKIPDLRVPMEAIHAGKKNTKQNIKGTKKRRV